MENYNLFSESVMANQKEINFEDIKNAYDRIKPYIKHTPLLRQESMEEKLNCNVYIKPEMLQITGAFKLRGALSKLLTLSEDEIKRGIITSSSGNHGLACAFLGKLFNIPVVVVLPKDTPEISIEKSKSMGSKIILWDTDYKKRWDKINEEVIANGYNIIHPFEDAMVVAGQGTIGLEILEDLADVDTIVIPIGGGGLISGTAIAAKSINPNIRIVGVQPKNSAPYYHSRQMGTPTPVKSVPTIANGLACRKVGVYDYQLIEKYVDEIVLVDESEIKEGIKFVAKESKLIAEPSSCVGIAASLFKKIVTKPNEKVVYVLTSGNWDIDQMGKLYNDESVEGIL